MYIFCIEQLRSIPAYAYCECVFACSSAARVLAGFIPNPRLCLSCSATMSKSALDVAGCTHPDVRDLINGIYEQKEVDPEWENHGKPTFVKYRSKDAVIYYWDERDGRQFSGWWIGPTFGGHVVWSYNPNQFTQFPPSVGWKVPSDGNLDETLVINLIPPVPAPAVCKPVAFREKSFRKVNGELISRTRTHMKPVLPSDHPLVKARREDAKRRRK